jgi:succinate dehydrogenase / fumarate reductase flavoprotein subunit
VALANYTEIVEGRGTEHGGVWLDISHLPATTIRSRLPRMLAQFAAVGVDITRAPMEVAPTAHYSMGGIRVEAATHATDVPRLFAVGEVAAGLHGANRLGGNSLVELLVFGRRAGEAAGRLVVAEGIPPLDEPALERKRLANRRLANLDGRVQRALIDELQETMWRHAGVVRDATTLEQGLQRIEAIRRHADSTPSGAPDLPAALDLRSMLLTAEATVRSALLRTESRGAHRRSDYPATDPEWQRTILVQPCPADDAPNAGFVLATAEIEPPSDEIADVFAEADVEVAGRLVE